MSGNFLINMAYPEDGPLNELQEFGDTSGRLFSIYSKMVEEDDNKRAERHEKDAEGIILFTGLFSAALAALITVSVQDLKPGPNTQDSTTFSPPRYAIWVNSLWLSSLAISLTSALLATLLQQWARRYIKLARPLGCPHKRARTRQFFFSGDDNFHFLLATDAVPTLLHLSVFLFFAGLLVLLRNINHTVFNAVAVWAVLCVGVYAYATCRPIFRPACPHFTPLSSLVWHFYAHILYPPFNLLKRNIYNVAARRPLGRPARLFWRLEESASEIISKRSPKIDARILASLLYTQGDDGSREAFFEAIIGFYDSKVVQVQVVKTELSWIFITRFRHSMDQFVDDTLISDSISELVRSRRLLTCLKATHKVLGDRAGMSITDRIIRSENWDALSLSHEIGHILRRWRNSATSWNVIIGSCIIARIIARAGMRDDTWMALTMCQLGLTEKVLKIYLEHGDSVLLANLIYTTRLFIKRELQFQDILGSLSQFSVKDILPKLQGEFCTLWNEIVLRVQDGSSSDNQFDCVFILQEISSVYDALHPPAPTDVAATPASTSTSTSNYSLHTEFSYTLCADPQSPHLPTAKYTTASRQGTAPSINEPSDIPHTPQQTAPVATSSLPPRRDRPLSRPLQRNATNLVPHVEPDDPSSLAYLAPLGELSVDIDPALDLSDSTTTSYILATPGENSISDSSSPDSTSRSGKSLA